MNEMKLHTFSLNDMPRDFPLRSVNSLANYLRWLHCEAVSSTIAELCFDSSTRGPVGTKEDILANVVSVMCGESYSESERGWLILRSAAQLS